MRNDSQKGLAEKTALKLATKIKTSDRNKTDPLYFIKMKYGLEILIINLSKIFFIFCMATILGIAKETLSIMISFAFVRRYAFGAHSQNSVSCTIITSIGFFSGVYMSKFLDITNYHVILIFLITLILICLYAPADTEQRPLIGKSLRKKLKIKAVLSVTILGSLAIYIDDPALKFFMSYGALCESITITPIIYKLFGGRYRNYEYYKKGVN